MLRTCSYLTSSLSNVSICRLQLYGYTTSKVTYSYLALLNLLDIVFYSQKATTSMQNVPTWVVCTTYPRILVVGCSGITPAVPGSSQQQQQQTVRTVGSDCKVVPPATQAHQPTSPLPTHQPTSPPTHHLHLHHHPPPPPTRLTNSIQSSFTAQSYPAYPTYLAHPAYPPTPSTASQNRLWQCLAHHPPGSRRGDLVNLQPFNHDDRWPMKPRPSVPVYQREPPWHTP